MDWCISVLQLGNCQVHVGAAALVCTQYNLVGLLQEAFRKAAIAALTKRLQSSLAAATAAAGLELDPLWHIQAQLTQ